ncbi:hypothetical protein GQR58_003272 [Nymphon striatum]|nr:hypothetical protein GQR58_003272 [Nymphon striatum]
MKVDPKNLAKQLKNVGPKLAERLIEVQIDTPEKLKEMGAKSAYLKMYEQGDAYGDFNAAYIYALEGAIQDCDWLDLPEELKQEYREFSQNLQSEKK